MSRKGIVRITCFTEAEGGKIPVDSLSEQERQRLSEKGKTAVGKALGLYLLGSPEKAGVFAEEPREQPEDPEP